MSRAVVVEEVITICGQCAEGAYYAEIVTIEGHEVVACEDCLVRYNVWGESL